MARLLLMEDDTAVAFEIAHPLREAGHDVVLSKSASEAKDELWHWDFDLLITDLVVRRHGRPVADGGLSLISWVRYTVTNTSGLRYLPIIAICGESSQPGMDVLLTTAARIGADLVLEKPVETSELLKSISKLVSQLNNPAMNASQ